jgi:hypothetical protein
MRSNFVIAAAAVLFAAAPAHAQSTPAADPAATGYAQQIVDLILPPSRYHEITDKAVRSITDQMRAAMLGRVTDPGLRQIVEGYVAKMPDRLRPLNEKHLPLIVQSMVRAYTREFSLDELKQISSFAQTPAGIHYIGRSFALLSDPGVVAANQAFFNEAGQLAQVGTPEVRSQVAMYLRLHPEVAKQLQAQQQAARPPQRRTPRRRR